MCVVMKVVINVMVTVGGGFGFGSDAPSSNAGCKQEDCKEDGEAMVVSSFDPLDVENEDELVKFTNTPKSTEGLDGGFEYKGQFVEAPTPSHALSLDMAGM